MRIYYIVVLQAKIEGYFDEIKGIVYLHIDSLLDADQFIKKYESMAKTDGDEKADFLSIYDKVRSSFAKVFFILFYVCHVIVVSHPGSTFDVNYIQYFKAADLMR